jgi:endonuclease YncB( thermonuclease family)
MARPRGAWGAGLCAALLLAFASTAGSGTLEGRVTHVTDGDTIWVRPSQGGTAVEVRLHGIDAPEICQPFGVQAREALASRLRGRKVVLDVRAQDAYERTLARVSLQGQDIGAWLVSGGWAWSSGFRHRAGPYAQEQTAARAERRGLWADDSPLDPRRFRRLHGSCYAPR